jgi:hypothetical protein
MLPIGVETVRELGNAAGVPLAAEDLETLAEGLRAMLEALDRADDLQVAKHEPATGFRLTGGPADAEL